MWAGRIANGLIWSVIAAVATLGAVLVVSDSQASRSASGLVVAVIFSTLCAAVSAIVIGLPAHSLLHRRRINGITSYLLVGALAAIAPFLVASVGDLLEGRQFDWQEVDAWSRLAIPCGVVGAATFWAVAVRYRG